MDAIFSGSCLVFFPLRATNMVYIRWFALRICFAARARRRFAGDARIQRVGFMGLDHRHNAVNAVTWFSAYSLGSRRSALYVLFCASTCRANIFHRRIATWIAPHATTGLRVAVSHLKHNASRSTLYIMVSFRITVSPRCGLRTLRCCTLAWFYGSTPHLLPPFIATARHLCGFLLFAARALHLLRAARFAARRARAALAIHTPHYYFLRWISSAWFTYASRLRFYAEGG